MKIYILIAISLFAIKVFSQDEIKKGEFYYVWANSGLNLRENGLRDSKVLVTIPYGEKVLIDSIIEMDDFEQELFSSVRISDKMTPAYSIKGRMIKVSYGNHNGFVFSGFLSRVKPIFKNVIFFDLDKIFEKEYGIAKQFDFGDSDFINIEILYNNGYLHFRRAYVYWFNNVYMTSNVNFNEGLLIIKYLIEKINKDAKDEWFLSEKNNLLLEFSEMNTEMYTATARQLNNVFIFTLDGSN